MLLSDPVHSNRLSLSWANSDLAHGHRVLDSLVRFGLDCVASLHQFQLENETTEPSAVMSRLRGTGPKASFQAALDELDRTIPINLVSPFEGSDFVSGAIWPTVHSQDGKHHAVAKLNWDAGAGNLPMHAHQFADRCIIVAEGRGFFHVSDESLDEFSGNNVRTIAARNRDVFIFSRGVMHTFSTTEHPLTLISCQLPYFPFDDPNQYELPKRRWTASEQLLDGGTVTLDPAWSVLAQQANHNLVKDSSTKPVRNG